MTGDAEMAVARGIDVVSTDLFVGTTEDPRQVLRVTVTGLQGTARVTVSGAGVSGELVTTGAVAEIGVLVDAAAEVGDVLPVQVQVVDDAGTLTADGTLVVAEPGWTMYLISHFHYDPVWWATQAAYAVTWNESDEIAQRFRMGWQQPGFALIETHLDLARRDADYKFVLAEVDLLKPYWDARPDQRAYLRRLVAEGRLELLGGTYNEPNTNLTSAEVTIRNFVYGAGFQRDLFGADPATAWQLDAFGHDPQFPGLAADAGVSSSSWARGPYRPWGPMLTAFLPGPEGWGDPRGMQFSSEFEWIAPSGRGLTTHYMPAHYSAGWVLDDAASREEAEAKLYELFSALKDVAATRNVLLPVGTDYTPPNRWLTDVHRHWNETYVWPRFVCAVPREFFAAVEAELAAEGRTLSPQTRDMNPIFTGKDVSFIDTKQAHRAAETALVDAEKFAVFARSVGAAYPHVAFDKAWRHLLYGAHHDAVTGSESDQVYLDLLTNWHEALDLAIASRDDALEAICSRVRGTGSQRVVTVFNPSSWLRTDLVTAQLDLPDGELTGLAVVDADGESVPALLDVLSRHADGSLDRIDVTFLAAAVPSLGYRSWRVVPAAADPAAGWQTTPDAPTAIESAAYRLTVDPARGGGVSSVRDLRADRELMSAGSVGNTLRCTREYPEHPTFNEGPWHLLPTGETTTSAEAPAHSVTVASSPIGQRITVQGELAGVGYRQSLTLWAGIDRLDCRTELHGFTGADQLFRVSWPAGIDGAMPVSEVGNAVVGRGHAMVDADSAEHPWTLDNPAYGFFALSSTARVEVSGPDGQRFRRAIGTAEIVTAGEHPRALAVALARAGVTATSSTAAGPRYGSLGIDSNLPDVRISLGLPADNAFTAAVLAGAPDLAAEWHRQLAAGGSARVWVPAAAALSEVWQPSADLRGTHALPVLLAAGPDCQDELAADLDDAVIVVTQQVPVADTGLDLDDFTVGLVNRGTPGFAVDIEGALHMSLMRSCTGWPSGVWIDPPHRTMPDGSTFQQQHWSHTFDYSLASGAGDWRAAGLVTTAHDVNHPLIAHSHLPAGDLLPDELSFLEVDADGEVVVTAVKATGNPLADGRLAAGHEGVTVRLYESAGRPATVRLRSHSLLADAQRLDLLEQPRDSAGLTDTGGLVELTLDAGEVATVAGRLLPMAPPAEGAPSAGYREPVQPIYTRYWLNNTGTAPAGNLPVAVHFVEDHVRTDGAVQVAVTVASTLVDTVAEGTVTIHAPAGWSIDVPSRDYVLGAGAHCRLDATVTVPEGTPAGCYVLSAEIEHDGQAFHDLCRVLVGGADPERVHAELTTGAVRLAPGEAGTIRVRVSSDGASDLPAQVQLISPWDVWSTVPGWNTGTVVPAGGSTEVDFEVVVPVGMAPGTWWALVKVAAAGRVQFTEAIDLIVTAS